jgi:hypothetical protein
MLFKPSAKKTFSQTKHLRGNASCSSSPNKNDGMDEKTRMLKDSWFGASGGLMSWEENRDVVIKVLIACQVMCHLVFRESGCSIAGIDVKLHLSMQICMICDIALLRTMNSQGEYLVTCAQMHLCLAITIERIFTYCSSTWIMMPQKKVA